MVCARTSSLCQSLCPCLQSGFLLAACKRQVSLSKVLAGLRTATATAIACRLPSPTELHGLAEPKLRERWQDAGMLPGAMRLLLYLEQSKVSAYTMMHLSMDSPYHTNPWVQHISGIAGHEGEAAAHCVEEFRRLAAESCGHMCQQFQ